MNRHLQQKKQTVAIALWFATCCFFASANSCWSQEVLNTGSGLLPQSMKLASKAVRASTVTIRVDRNPTLDLIRQIDSQAAPKPEASKVNRPENSVAVFSGVLVKQGFVATPLFLPNSKNPEVRITLPDGEQTVGRPRILDEYSGLAILSIKDLTIPCLKCCQSKEPVVGDWVVSGAAWGRQEALVSLGMISGIGYRVPNSKIESPPMIVCDLRAAETSRGSGVVAANGKLIGVVMSVSRDQKWTYVVPAKHINRLLRSLAQHEKRSDFSKDDILVLKRQPPRMGWRIDPRDWNKESRSYRLMVGSVTPKGAVEQAGIKVGDQVRSVNGKVVRAKYDLVRDVYYLQPGDKVNLGILRGEKKLDIPVVLGGGFAASGESIMKLKDYIRPKIDLDNLKGKAAPKRNSEPLNQLVYYSLQNLAPAPCFDSDAITDLLDLLEKEKANNAELNSRIEVLESKFNRLMKMMEDK